MNRKAPGRLITIQSISKAFDFGFYVKGKLRFDLDFTGNDRPIALQNVYGDYVD
jgi:hypothetical protein